MKEAISSWNTFVFVLVWICGDRELCVEQRGGILRRGDVRSENNNGRSRAGVVYSLAIVRLP